MTNDHVISYYWSHITRSVKTHPNSEQTEFQTCMYRWSGWGWAVCTLQWILCSPVEMSLNKSITIIHGLKHMKSKSSTNSHSDEARARSEHNILMLNKDSGSLKWNHGQQQKTQGNLYASRIMSNFKAFIQMQILEDTVFAISAGNRPSRWFERTNTEVLR